MSILGNIGITRREVARRHVVMPETLLGYTNTKTFCLQSLVDFLSKLEHICQADEDALLQVDFGKKKKNTEEKPHSTWSDLIFFSWFRRRLKCSSLQKNIGSNHNNYAVPGNLPTLTSCCSHVWQAGR